MSTPHRILIVDDEPAMIDYLTDTLEAHGFEVRGATSGAHALSTLKQWRCDLVLSDVVMPGLRGTDLLRAILADDPTQKVILMTAFGSIELAIQSIKAGASDFLIKPFKQKVLIQLIHDLLSNARARPQATEATDGLVAVSAPMVALLKLARRAAATPAAVLITGESGVGKGALTREIHRASQRAGGPLVHLNCAALPAALVEAELFGVKRGAFTDAREDRAGLIAQAHGGTLFLDEVGELPLEIQPKLLDVLESGQVRAVGATVPRPVNVRIIAATNRDLEAAVAANQFRADLYWRLHVVHLHVPPLRERIEDILPLAEHLLAQHAPHLSHASLTLSEDARRAIVSYSWPGNIRELDNLLYRAAILSSDSVIDARDLGLPDEAWTQTLTHAEAPSSPSSEFLSLPELERQHIQRALELAHGNKSQAARLLGIHRKTLYRKLEELGEGSDDEE